MKKRIGGWLLIFCIGLTILGPLTTIGGNTARWHDSQPSFYYYPALKQAMIWEMIGSYVILIYGFVVGCMIWSGKPNGLSVVKRYLLIRLFAWSGIELVTILLMHNLPSRVFAEASGGMFALWIREILFFVIWWFYFKNSERVANTYGHRGDRYDDCGRILL